MNRPGLVLGTLWAVTIAWVVALIVAPLVLAPGTVTGLHGNANVVDYWPLWRTLPWFPRVVYTLGDANCHQIASRSWSVHGNQLPVDARMTAAFVGAVLGLPLAMLVAPRWSVRDMFVSVLPVGWRRPSTSPARRSLLLAAAWLVAAGPATLDVALQGATPYESTNLLRATTGLLLGAGVAFLVGLTLASLLAQTPGSLAAGGERDERDPRGREEAHGA